MIYNGVFFQIAPIVNAEQIISREVTTLVDSQVVSLRPESRLTFSAGEMVDMTFEDYPDHVKALKECYTAPFSDGKLTPIQKSRLKEDLIALKQIFKISDQISLAFSYMPEAWAAALAGY